MSYHWVCLLCKAEGYVPAPQWTGVWEMYRRIAAEHQRVSTECCSDIDLRMELVPQEEPAEPRPLEEKADAHVD